MPKVKVEFYAHGFRECIINVPDGIKKRTPEAEEFIKNQIGTIDRLREY